MGHIKIEVQEKKIKLGRRKEQNNGKKKFPISGKFHCMPTGQIRKNLS